MAEFGRCKCGACAQYQNPDTLATGGNTAPDSELYGVCVLILKELRELRQKIDDMEAQAKDMMSPDAMMKMAEGFLGKSFGL